MKVAGKITDVFSILTQDSPPSNILTRLGHISAQYIAVAYEGLMGGCSRQFRRMMLLKGR
ncbi:MAG TPA: hypothetical protein ENI68_11035 [Gammaproteobacteria bacterium]|nr:hypothetical protein [Gammaproteobacteria bacterium]